MEGEKNNKEDAMPPQLGLDPDDPVPSIEGSKSTEDAVTATLPRRERTQPRRGLDGSQRRQTPNTHQIPPQLLGEQSGSAAACAENLGGLLGLLNPRAHQQQAVDRAPDGIAAYHASLSAFPGPINPHGQQQLDGRVPSSRDASHHASSGNLPGPVPRSDPARVPHRRINSPGHITTYRRIAMAPARENTLSRSIQAPQDLQQRIQSQAVLSTSGHGSYSQQTGGDQSFTPAPDNPVMGRDRPTVPQASVNAATDRRLPLGSKTTNTNMRRMQTPPPRAILPGTSRTPLPSSAFPVPLSQQPTKARPCPEKTFSLTRNASLMLNPFSKIVPASVKLVADNGQLWEYKYPGTRRNWKRGPKGAVTVAKLNRWSNIILRRRLPDDFPAGPRSRSGSARPKPKADKWTEWERVYLEAHILDTINLKGGYLDEEGWQLVADAQNEEFLDYKRLPGLPLAVLTSRTLTIDNIPVMRGGGFTKTEGYFPERSASEIQSILYSWPEIQEKIKEAIRAHRGKIPAYLDCETDLSESELSSDDENGAYHTTAGDYDGM
ncbi:hypothetical protein DSL72_004972 [Monilinia vaccinii-corymbosi]|uniref:Uncharacterized protein n=1 Tax=Monilinia vaccinii-corymbosi TaxID=61207 RepID=A0A8A3PEB0_9HELO|nr:hypothetical protein DSL72_004972 [Monilinia vaccinii-corymbosi]